MNIVILFWDSTIELAWSALNHGDFFSFENIFPLSEHNFSRTPSTFHFQLGLGSAEAFINQDNQKLRLTSYPPKENQALDKCPKHFVRFLYNGRLGNLMTQYALAVALNMTYPSLDVVLARVSSMLHEVQPTDLHVHLFNKRKLFKLDFYLIWH